MTQLQEVAKQKESSGMEQKTRRKRKVLAALTGEAGKRRRKEEGTKAKAREKKDTKRKGKDNNDEEEPEAEENEDEEPTRGAVMKELSTATCTYYKSFTWRGIFAPIFHNIQLALHLIFT